VLSRKSDTLHLWLSSSSNYSQIVRAIAEIMHFLLFGRMGSATSISSRFTFWHFSSIGLSLLDFSPNYLADELCSPNRFSGRALCAEVINGEDFLGVMIPSILAEQQFT
jgi:hypothetical protein